MTPIRLRAATTALAIATLVACGAPTLAAAAGEPQITAASIDEQSRFVAAWQLAPGTTFDFVEFSTSSIADPDPVLREFFASGNLADYECAAPPRSCGLARDATSYRARYGVARDRRYFVRVNAEDAGGESRTSPVWVIDDTKPLIPGEPPTTGAPPTGVPALGHLFVPPAPETIPPPVLALRAPTAIATYARRGVRVKLTCPVAECFAQLRVRIGGATLTARNYTLAPDRPQTYAMRPEGTHLRHRRSARVRLHAVVHQPGGKTTRIVRSFSVRR